MRRATRTLYTLALDIGKAAGIGRGAGDSEKSQPQRRRARRAPQASPDAIVLEPLGSEVRVVEEQRAEVARSRSTRTAPDVGRRRFVVLLAVVLYLFGTIMVTSATSGTTGLVGDDQWLYLRKQLIFGGLGFLAMIAAMHVPLALLRRFSRAFLTVAVLFLLLVFVPGLGIEANGATRWLNFGAFQMQPSELVKIGVLLVLADHLARTAPPNHWRRDFLASPAGVGLALCAVVVTQHDLGSALVTGSMLVGLYLAAGTSKALLARTMGPVLVLVILSIIAMPFRRQRFLAFLNPWADPHGPGYQLVQALVAIGSGGVFGVGLGHSVEKIHYLPEAHTDMIFSIIAEELGLLGVAIVLFGFCALAIVGGRIAVKAEDRFHSLLATGLTLMLCGQAALNLAGVVGVLPLTGVPLPLISYGGSSLVVVLASLGLLANVATASASDRARPATTGGADDA